MVAICVNISCNIGKSSRKLALSCDDRKSHTYICCCCRASFRVKMAVERNIYKRTEGRACNGGKLRIKINDSRNYKNRTYLLLLLSFEYKPR